MRFRHGKSRQRAGVGPLSGVAGATRAVRNQTAKRAKSLQLGSQRGGSALLVAVGACGGYTARPDHFRRARLRGVTVAVAALVGGLDRRTRQDRKDRRGKRC